jgi:hypothetical protein
MNLDSCSSHSSKNPQLQTIWLGFHSVEALTWRSAPPSHKSGRGFYIAQTNRVFGISSLHSRHTKKHQNSLLPPCGRRIGDEGGIMAVSRVTPKSSFFRALGDHKGRPYKVVV